MTLQEKLNSLKERFKASAPQETLAVMHKATEDLRNSGIMERILKVGDKAPGFTLQNAESKSVSSDDLLAKGPLVVSFYRGKW